MIKLPRISYTNFLCETEVVCPSTLLSVNSFSRNQIFVTVFTWLRAYDPQKLIYSNLWGNFFAHIWEKRDLKIFLDFLKKFIRIY